MEVLIPLLSGSFFILMWIGITGLVSIVGGWRGLATSCQPPRMLHEAGMTYSFQSVRLGFFGGYNSCITVTVYSQGVRIAPIFLFSLFHKPLYFPYAAMNNVSCGRFLMHYVTFELGGRKIRIMGRSAQAIKEKQVPH